MIEKLYWDDRESVGLIQKALSGGKVIVGASDTVFGLLAPLSKNGINLLNEIKNRQNKPYLVLLGGKDKLEPLVDSDQLARIEPLVDACWPGPLTLILRAKEGGAAFLASRDGTIAVRVPDHAGLLEILDNFDGLFSTSANMAGDSVPERMEDVNPSIIEQSAYVVLDREEKRKSVPSTILDCTGAIFKVIREGAYDVDELEEVCGQTFMRQ